MTVDDELTPDQAAIKQMVADFARRELAERAFQPETDAQYRERLRKLAQQGLLGMTAPEAYGGGGLSFCDALRRRRGDGAATTRAAPTTCTPTGPARPATCGCWAARSSRSAGCARSAKGSFAAPSP